MMKYHDAIYWLVKNDDTEWVNDPNGSPSITACLVADIYGNPEDDVAWDLKVELRSLSVTVENLMPSYQYHMGGGKWVWVKSVTDGTVLFTRIGRRRSSSMPIAEFVERLTRR